MAKVLSPTQQSFAVAPEPLQLTAETRLPPPTQTLSIPEHPPASRHRHLNLDAFSPVNQNGHFEFDRVLKSGLVHKRTRKTKVGAITDIRAGCTDVLRPQQWRSFYLVLRPNLLSIYKSPSEERLHKQISLSDLSAVAYLKDPKGKRHNVFGLFSPSRNFHFQTGSPEETRSWVELIKREARIDQEEQGMLDHSHKTFEAGSEQQQQWDHDRQASSSPEPLEAAPRTSTTRDGIRIPSAGKPSTHDLEYSGTEHASYSDFSDTAPAPIPPQSNLPSPKAPKTSPYNPNAPPKSLNASQHSVLHSPTNTETDDPERVIWHGYLLCLKSQRGVRQWKRLWAVLRPKNLAFYKNEDEYSAQLILPLANIVGAMEIDPVSKSKAYCMQVIAEEKSYRFCAPSEEALARWLGALKSQIAKRREKVDGGRR
ncbi:MAG: hypothetical protein HETSPECPRED_003430 [Heterodermia speciosa]|uniref:PH domain-containing protein n=1 Tax=Heterodermia speciosa TaxID=116794 RepID=A0A8H3I201_9LECA|nr:MAG: hypothetical protein HETSPECPRED_003430 [Heterodermia speciosa]